MHSWKKKLVVSQLALACTLAITSQANAATNDISGQTYNTFHHYNDATYADDVYYDGYVGWNNYAADSYYNGDIYPVINNATGFAPIFPDICYHLTHYKPAAADIPVASDNPAHYADAIRYNARTPLQGSLLPLTRLVWA